MDDWYSDFCVPFCDNVLALQPLVVLLFSMWTLEIGMYQEWKILVMVSEPKLLWLGRDEKVVLFVNWKRTRRYCNL